MKKIIKILLILTVFMFPNIVIASGSANGSAPGTIENGSSATFTVKISNTAAWNLKLSGKGATGGCSQSFADVTANGNNTSKSFSITCKANSIGTITFTATGDITSADGSNSNVSITKTVNVVKPREKETESRLSSLTVDGYTIKFNKDKENYTIEVEPSVTSITIKAKAISTRASITGTGTKEVEPDGNKFQIISTAENGAKKTYTINVSVIDKNPIKAKIDNVEYTVVKSSKQLTAPTNGLATITKINNMDIPSFKIDSAKINVVGLKDKEGNVKYAVFDNKEYKIYNENKSSELLLYITDKKLDGYKKIKIKINGVEYPAYEINQRFKIIYAMNLQNGEYNYYKYDTIENTYQLLDLKNNENSNNNIYFITTIIFAITTFLASGYIVYNKIKNKK